MKKANTHDLQLVKSTPFQFAMMVLLILNAIINASFVYKHDETDEERKLIYYYIEASQNLFVEMNDE